MEEVPSTDPQPESSDDNADFNIRYGECTFELQSDNDEEVSCSGKSHGVYVECCTPTHPHPHLHPSPPPPPPTHTHRMISAIEYLKNWHHKNKSALSMPTLS